MFRLSATATASAYARATAAASVAVNQPVSLPAKLPIAGATAKRRQRLATSRFTARAPSTA